MLLATLLWCFLLKALRSTTAPPTDIATEIEAVRGFIQGEFQTKVGDCNRVLDKFRPGYQYARTLERYYDEASRLYYTLLVGTGYLTDLFSVDETRIMLNRLDPLYGWWLLDKLKSSKKYLTEHPEHLETVKSAIEALRLDMATTLTEVSGECNQALAAVEKKTGQEAVQVGFVEQLNSLHILRALTYHHETMEHFTGHLEGDLSKVDSCDEHEKSRLVKEIRTGFSTFLRWYYHFSLLNWIELSCRPEGQLFTEKKAKELLKFFEDPELLELNFYSKKVAREENFTLPTVLRLLKKDLKQANSDQIFAWLKEFREKAEAAGIQGLPEIVPFETFFYNPTSVKLPDDAQELDTWRQSVESAPSNQIAVKPGDDTTTNTGIRDISSSSGLYMKIVGIIAVVLLVSAIAFVRYKRRSHGTVSNSEAM